MVYQSYYEKQVELLLDLIPEINKFDCFAIKGGTAINLVTTHPLSKKIIYKNVKKCLTGFSAAKFQILISPKNIFYNGYNSLFTIFSKQF